MSVPHLPFSGSRIDNLRRAGARRSGGRGAHRAGIAAIGRHARRIPVLVVGDDVTTPAGEIVLLRTGRGCLGRLGSAGRFGAGGHQQPGTNQQQDLLHGSLHGFASCSSRIRAQPLLHAMRYHTGWRSVWPPDVFLCGNRVESGATWPDRDDERDRRTKIRRSSGRRSPIISCSRESAGR